MVWYAPIRNSAEQTRGRKANHVQERYEVDAGNKTSYTLTGLQDGKKYYFAAKAYNSGKTTWSGFSNEVSATTAPATATPVASFTASPSSGVAPLTVTFTDTSTGNITSRSWNFGDGTTSTATGAAKTYPNPGTYTVTLTVTGPAGSNTATKTILATAVASVASFTATPRSGTAPLPVAFTDNSTGSLTAWSWSFGDGGTSTARNPIYTYPTAGTYTVSLTRTTQGRFGKALSFDGVNDWVTINDSASLDLTTGMTLEAWVCIPPLT